jgi:hypothetical protein
MLLLIIMQIQNLAHVYTYQPWFDSQHAFELYRPSVLL